MNTVSKRWVEACLGAFFGAAVIAIYEVPTRMFALQVNGWWTALPFLGFLAGIFIIQARNRKNK